jgi:hypothetical protein
MSRCGRRGEKRRSKDVHKKLFSKVSWVGGARVFTVGLGVMMAVMLGLAATPAQPLPAINLDFIRVEHSFEEYPFRRDDPSGAADDGPPYTVPVVTRWDDTGVSTLPNWIGTNCTATRAKWELQRRVGTDPAWQLVKQGTTEQSAEVVQRLQTDTRYQYRWQITCKKANPSGSGTQLITRMNSGGVFQIEVVEDNQLVNRPDLSLSWAGDWLIDDGGSYSGGATHEAQQDGAYAVLLYEGLAAAWVTTLDSFNTRARVECLDGAGNLVGCGRVNTENGQLNRYQRVAWTSNSWAYQPKQPSPVNANQEIRVISEENEDFDVDAFFVVYAMP